MFQRLHQLVHGQPFAQPVPQHLRDEFEGWPPRRRRQVLRKVAQRELAIGLTGQHRHLRERIPAGTRRLLWWTGWETVGDAVTDLSSRFLLPSSIETHLLICPALAPLYAGDERFARVHTRLDDCPRDIDFLLMQHFSSAGLRGKRRCFRAVPFASMLGHMPGEMFSRVHFADARMRQLLGLPPGEPCAPRLHLAPLPPPADGRLHVAVALGARDEKRRFRHWPALLAEVLRRWPADWPAPCFHLMGVGNARADVLSLPRELLASHVADHVDRLDLLHAARRIAGCDAFLGPDGGLMHLANATGRPGLAMFTTVPPAYRLLPDAPVQGVALGPAGDAVGPAQLAQAFVDRLRRSRADRGFGHALDPHA